LHHTQFSLLPFGPRTAIFDGRKSVAQGADMSAIRIAVTVVGAAITVSRHPAVRAGINAVATNPKARETAIAVTRSAAYNAGVLARHLIGRRTR
jgi:hypothetical protein